MATMVQRVRRALAAAFVLAALMLTLGPAQLAFAKIDPDDVHINILRDDIDATLSEDGALSVSEVRCFEGSFNGLYWYVPAGEYEGQEVETTIESVGLVVNGTLMPLTLSSSNDDGTYELTEYSDAVRIKVFSEHYEERVYLAVDYTMENLGRRYDDTSELYWQFVTSGWSNETQNITCTVHLPVPEGKQVYPGENVRAWGHGPLDAEVSFEGDDVVYTVPGVGTDEFAEARIVFPDDWLSEATSQGGERLRTILDEEQRWADEANARRARARMLVYGGAGIVGLGNVACIIGVIAAWLGYKRSHKPQFDDKYFRDVPSDDHPAVLGGLYRGGKTSSEDFTATLMRLSDMGAINLDLVTTTEGKRKKNKQDYRLTCPASTADKKLDHIDRQALLTLFDQIGRYAPKRAGDTGDVIYFSDLEKIGKNHPRRFADAYDQWDSAVQGEMATRRFFIEEKVAGENLSVACCAGSVLLLMTAGFLLFGTGAWGVFIPVMLLGAITLVASLVCAGSCEAMSDEAVELKAKLKALRNWLKDFTRLEEAVPRDVVLWNRLLVMAVVLGVADDVIKQLKVAVPEILEDPRIMTTYGWYRTGPIGRPFDSFNKSYETAHSVSADQLSSSSSSSGGGFGGGFSSGGGGGFGGGGGGHSGGGAF